MLLSCVAELVLLSALATAAPASLDAAPSGSLGAAPETAQEFEASYIGEGGSYEPPNGPASDYFEHGSKPKPPRSGSPLPELPALPRSEGTPSPPKRDAFSAMDPAAVRLREKRLKEKEAEEGIGRSYSSSRHSLWEGLISPLELPAGKAATIRPDEASRLGRSDYDSHILGSGQGAGGGAVGSEPLLPPAGEASQVFVMLSLDVKDGDADLHDALADISRASGFRSDPRFPPRRGPSLGSGTAAPAGAVSLWGWMPASELGKVLKHPSVSRVELENSSARGLGGGAWTELWVGLRLPEEVAPLTMVRRFSEDLAERAGFRWKRTVGIQQIPGSSQRALVVVGEVPIRRLSKLMSHPDVLRIEPVVP